MPRRALSFVLASMLLVSALVAVGVASCTTPETTVVVPGCTTSEPTLSIVSPVNGACWAVSAGDDAYVPVVVSAGNFLLRPPGQCTGCDNCGHLRLSVNGVVNNDSATSVVDVLFSGAIPDHFQTMKLTVDLVDDCGRPWQSVDGGVACDAGPPDAGHPDAGNVCKVDGDCKEVCQAGTCTGDNACAFAPLPDGTVCELAGSRGTCTEGMCFLLTASVTITTAPSCGPDAGGAGGGGPGDAGDGG
jgi:hypothetical protein